MDTGLVVLIAIAALAAGGFVGHYFGTNPAAVAALKTDFTALESKVAATASALEVKVKADAAAVATQAHALVAKSAAASAPAAASAAPPTATVVPWELGTSYTNLGALAADIDRPDFVREIDIDGVPVFHIGGGNPVAFFSVNGQLTQTKPA